MKIKKAAKLFSTNARKRYEAKHDIITYVAKKCGFRTYNRNLAWFTDEDYKSVWMNYPETNNYIHERKFTLFNIARSLKHIPGDIAECGVFRAGSSFLMLTASDDPSNIKHFHGFDSFEGLSEPKDKDKVHNDHTFIWEKNDMAVGENIAKANLEGFKDRVTLYKGWIPERFDEVKDKKFSLVHIDVDLYEPTKQSLEFFGPRVQPGGMIVCDDYGSEACPGAKKAMDEYAAKHNNYVIHLTTGQGIINVVSAMSQGD